MSEKERLLKKINPNCFGGSENQFRFLMKYVPDEYFKDINLILNNSSFENIEKDKINILWIQHFVGIPEIKNIQSKDYLNKIDYFVFNSNWNYEKFRYKFNIPEDKSIVIRNAVEEIIQAEKNKKKIKLIYHSTPWRGLSVLLNVFEKLKSDSVELDVCSSTIIYGKEFYDKSDYKYQKLYEKCKQSEKINYLGYLSNQKLIEHIKTCHIFAFPSIWIETSCISAIEAMAAGCSVVTSNLGALYETCTPFANFVHFDQNLKNFERDYFLALQKTIDNYWSEENQEILNLQIKTVNKLYSWKTRSQDWINFLRKVKK
tara:strand:+ start:556 stop:1503 length:948 start_codon:yes stop_codon:yes gene_type:complete